MLVALHVRDIVLIDSLSLEFSSGLCVLTGETGAGKSIILDALGLALGARFERRLVRTGAEQGIVSAEFQVAQDHQSLSVLDELGIPRDETVILRRIGHRDGKSRCFVNDQPVSRAALKQIGERLVEIHGQHEAHGLFDVSQHRALLDAYGDLGKRREAVRTCHQDYAHLAEQLERHRKNIAEAETRLDYLNFVLTELDQLDPQADEEEALAERRLLLMNGEKISAALEAVSGVFAGERGLDSTINKALRKIEGVAEHAPQKFAPLIERMVALINDGQEVSYLASALSADLDYDPAALEQTESRLFALRAASRKYRVPVDGLAAHAEQLRKEVGDLTRGEERLDELEMSVEEAKQNLIAEADKLSKARTKTATAFDRAVMKELKPLKLGKAHFKTSISPQSTDVPGAEGWDRVEFQVSTNDPGSFGPLSRVASGGELARFALAMRVALSTKLSSSTMIFDEVDQGVGGAVAAAVGSRLSTLASASQVIVVTHSPQVAARGSDHLRVHKSDPKRKKRATVTTAERLTSDDRQEEIARMLAGAQVTDEARAAAAKLIADAR